MKDEDAMLLLKKIHVAYVEAVLNPFYAVGKPIQSRAFIENMKRIASDTALQNANPQTTVS